MYNVHALENILNGVRSRYGLMVCTKMSTTMVEQMNFIKKEENIKYLQNIYCNSSQNNFNIINKTNPAKQNSPIFSPISTTKTIL